ncbi:tryptophan halogenase [Asticcacaulis biprosthecium C19]|uniref:Tryptophan halogenase n=1 Tax=Asticcacaulis biprosthecium C19 TaxID=715226 RepID=F4QM55_9CAUL|nr:tryptophan halogenase family protein [Asticcacaulis biprosthecium]EGF93627.1 tryptophan halogenase [Asticcacaulis biprosthecium C19]
MTGRVEHIVIVGGGSAGWMAAAGLSRYMRNMPVRITVVESDEIGTIGVGEASVPLLAVFNSLVGLHERDFIQATQGTFKLGIEFAGWNRPGESYLHPFSPYGQSLGVCDFHQYWLKARAAGYAAPLEDFNLNAALARDSRFNLRSSDGQSPMSILSYAYHFDAGLYARNLRTLAQSYGVNRVEGRIVEVEQQPETGFITGVKLASGQRVEGDFFVDCSGFRALLIEGALEAGFNDWTGLLPCDSAVAVPSARTEPLLPFTRATAREAGWQWRIPLQHRTGNGYVYSSRHISDDAAAATLMANLDGRPLGDPRIIRFRTGRRSKAWVKNCVAVGLSAGFLEPLESTSIHLIQKGVMKLLTFMPSASWSHALADEFNRQTAFDYEEVRDFLVLHYKANGREGQPFWDALRNNPVSDTLQARIDLFRDSGRVFIDDRELFKLPSWVTVLTKQGIFPRDYDPMAEAVSTAEITGRLEQIRMILNRTAQAQPTHADFIARNCKTFS